MILKHITLLKMSGYMESISDNTIGSLLTMDNRASRIFLIGNNPLYTTGRCNLICGIYSKECCMSID